MKLELTEPFVADLDRLSRANLAVVRVKFGDFVAACDHYASNPSSKWPASLRVKPVEAAPGVFEVTFSFAGPDIRATFEWTTIDGELAVRWRRIGGHRIFSKP